MKTMKMLTLFVLLLLALSMAYAAKPGDKPDPDKYVGFMTKHFGTVYISEEQAARMRSARDIVKDQLGMLANTLDWDTEITMKDKNWHNRVLVVRTDGTEVETGAAGSWSPVWQTRGVLVNTQVQTGANSQATIVLPSGTSIVMGPNTQITITKNMLLHTTTLRLIYGQLQVDVKRFFGKEDDLEITAPNGALSARGTNFEVRVDEEKTLIRVYEGTVEVKDFYDNSTFYVGIGQEASLWEDQPKTVGLIVDEEPLEITLSEAPCSFESQISFSVDNTQAEDNIPDINLSVAASKKIDWKQFIYNLADELANATDLMTAGTISNISTSTFCKSKDLKPRLVFVTNKILNPATVTPLTVEVRDENNKFVEGLYEVDSAITFIPARPLYGSIRILVKGGERGVCSRTKVCLAQDTAFELEGAPRLFPEEKNLVYELRNTFPALLTKSIVITNTKDTAAKDVAISTYSYKTYFPNTFVQLQNISSPVPYEILQQGENEVHRFKIKELPAGKSLIINETYAALSFGEEYFQRLDVSGLSQYDNATLVEMFTKPEEGIESDAPEIRELAQVIVGEEENPFWKAYKLYNWVTANVQYDYEKEAWITQLIEDEKAGITTPISKEQYGGAMITLYSGKGVCYDYARLYIALARAVGIPSRIVMLDVESGESEATGHSTVEIYLPKYGWIPLDPTWGRAYDNFAREEPFIFPDYKQDGISPSYEYFYEGEDVNQLKVLILKNIFPLEIKDEQEWTRFFPEPFFKDLYELVLSSNMKKYVEEFEVYNTIANESIFLLPSPSKRSSLVVTSQAIQAYKNKEYSSLRETVRKTSLDNLEASLSSFNSINKKIIDFLKKERKKEREQEQRFEEMTSGSQANTVLSLKIRYQEQNGTATRVNYSEIISQLETAFNHTQELNTTLDKNNPGKGAERFSEIFYNSWFTVDSWAYTLVSEIYLSKFRSAETIPVPAEEQTAPLSFKEQITQWIIIIFLFTAMPFFWLWMLIHCLVKKEFRHLNKILWFFIIFLTPLFFLLGAILYFFLEYRKRNKIGGRIIK